MVVVKNAEGRDEFLGVCRKHGISKLPDGRKVEREEQVMRAETERLQALFTVFNEGGSFMTMAEGDEEPIMLDLVDSYLVTRAAGDSFWLFHKMIGYNNGWQHAHTIKVVSWSQDDVWFLDLVDDRGRRFHIELIMPETEPDLVETWRRWQAYRARHREGFAQVDLTSTCALLWGGRHEAAVDGERLNCF